MSTTVLTPAQIATYQQQVYNAAMACGATGFGDIQGKIIMGQATLESEHFESNVFNTDNNCFGMKYPKKRPVTYIDGKSTIVMKSEGATPYAHYNTIERGIQDLILGYHVYHNTDWTKIDTPAKYAAYLVTKSYYPSDLEATYAKDIASIINDAKGIVKWIKKNPVTGIAIFIGIILLISLIK